MGMFDWDEDLIPLIQSPEGNAPTQAIRWNLSNSNILYQSVSFLLPFLTCNRNVKKIKFDRYLGTGT